MLFHQVIREEIFTKVVQPQGKLLYSVSRGDVIFHFTSISKPKTKKDQMKNKKETMFFFLLRFY